MKIAINIILTFCLVVAGLSYFRNMDPESTISRYSLFGKDKYKIIKIDSAASAVETIFAKKDTVALAKILSPTTLEKRRQYFIDLLPYMPAFAADFKTRKLLTASAGFAVYEFNSHKGKFTVEFCLGSNGQWMIMNF